MEEERARRSAAEIFLGQIVGKTLVKEGGHVAVVVGNRGFAQTKINGLSGSHPFDDAWLLKLREALGQGVFRIHEHGARALAGR